MQLTFSDERTLTKCGNHSLLETVSLAFPTEENVRTQSIINMLPYYQTPSWRVSLKKLKQYSHFGAGGGPVAPIMLAISAKDY